MNFYIGDVHDTRTNMRLRNYLREKEIKRETYRFRNEIFKSTTSRSKTPAWKGLGSIFGSLFKWLSPIVAKGVSVGKSALKNPHIRAGLKDVQKSAIKAGVRKIDQVLNPMEEEEEEE